MWMVAEAMVIDHLCCVSVALPDFSCCFWPFPTVPDRNDFGADDATPVTQSAEVMMPARHFRRILRVAMALFRFSGGGVRNS